MVRTTFVISLVWVYLAAFLNTGKGEYSFPVSFQFSSSFPEAKGGRVSPEYPVIIHSTTSKATAEERTSESDTDQADLTELDGVNDINSETNSTATEESLDQAADSISNPDDNMTDDESIGDEITAPMNRTNDPSKISSPLKTIYIDITKPGLGSPLTKPVFKENAFVGLFNSCSTVDVSEKMGPISADTCFDDDEYNDRITFEMSFLKSSDLIEHAFDKEPPKLFIQDDMDQIAEPTILMTDLSKASSTAKIVISYNCKSGSSGSIFLSLHLSFGDSEESKLSIPWTKTCSSGENDKIDFGYVLDNGSASGKINFNNDSEQSPLVVAPSDVSTEVFLKLQQPGAQQAFLAPYVTSSKPEVTDILVRGNHPSGGVLNGLEETSFQVSYNCEQKGSTEISVSIAFPPFDNITASWTKDCGGQVPSNLQVGTEIGSSDVVENGEPTNSFMVGIQHIGTEHSDEHLHLSGNQSDWKVFLLNSMPGVQSSASVLHIGRITLTVEHPENVVALEPQIRSKSALGWSSEYNSGYSLQPEQSLEVSFHFVCRRIGESRVLITLPILQYDTVEFGVAKRCTHLGSVRKSGRFVLTAGKAFASLIAVCIAVVVIIIRRRSSAKKGFEALPTTER